jgi:hypothetical protein
MTATTTTRIRPTRRAAVLGGLLGVGLLVAGCSSAPPAPAPDPATAAPVLLTDQNAKILQTVNDTLAKASKEKDPAALKSRLTAQALTVRSSQLKVAKVAGNEDLVTVLPTTYQQIILPTTQTWPRTTYAITDPDESADEPTTQRLIALEQATARKPYKLWGWVQLKPGVTMPAFADPAIGSDEVAPDDSSLTVTPKDVVSQYADALAMGDKSKFVDTFEPVKDDRFRQNMASIAAANIKALKGDNKEGTYTLKAEPRKGVPVKAVRTTDGGAMVLAALDLTESMKAVEGAEIAPPTTTAKALLKGKTLGNKLVQGYSDMVALYVPPAGSDQKVKLLGFSHVQTSASVG